MLGFHAVALPTSCEHVQAMVSVSNLSKVCSLSLETYAELISVQLKLATEYCSRRNANNIVLLCIGQPSLTLMYIIHVQCVSIIG